MSKATHFLRAFLAATVIVIGAQHSVVLASEGDEVTDQGGSGSGEPDVPDTSDVPDVPDSPGTPGTPDVPDGGGSTGDEDGGDDTNTGGGTDDPDTDTGNTDDDDSGTDDSGDDDASDDTGTNDDSSEDSGDVSSSQNTPNVQTAAKTGPLSAVTVEATLQQLLGSTVDVKAIVDLKDPPTKIAEQVSSSTTANAIVSSVSSSTVQTVAKIQSQVTNFYNNNVSAENSNVDGLRIM
jgi:hypothetical protein